MKISHSCMIKHYMSLFNVVYLLSSTDKGEEPLSEKQLQLINENQLQLYSQCIPAEQAFLDRLQNNHIDY